jgi:hypothetical protein
MDDKEDKIKQKSSKKVAQFFSCKSCDYTTSRKGNIDKHYLSAKHQRMTEDYNGGQKVAKSSKSSNNSNILFICCCGKEYKHRQGLWKHKTICETIIDTNDEFTSNTLNTSDLNTSDLNTNYANTIDKCLSDKELINILVKQNEKLMNLLEKGTTNTNCNNTTNNKTFNLNVYLNETCKNAMNITDFISSINLNLEDLENTGRRGYVEGISNIFFKNLNNLEQHMRPIHCSDYKREVLYIKDNDKWEKETNENPILTKAIKTVANENIKQITVWKNKYPDCTDSESKKNNLYLKIVSNSMNGITEEESKKNIQRIISNVAKEVTIEKN